MCHFLFIHALPARHSCPYALVTLSHYTSPTLGPGAFMSPFLYLIPLCKHSIFFLQTSSRSNAYGLWTVQSLIAHGEKGESSHRQSVSFKGSMRESEITSHFSCFLVGSRLAVRNPDFVSFLHRQIEQGLLTIHSIPDPHPCRLACHPLAKRALARARLSTAGWNREPECCDLSNVAFLGGENPTMMA